MTATRYRRRTVLLAGGLLLAGFATRSAYPAQGAGASSLIHMKSDPLGTQVGFDPIGLSVAPGTTVRWVVDANVHTTTAYHPANGRHSLRIPPGAKPWDSGYLVNPGDYFEATLTVEGVYDYFCQPHEAAGMVGRIVVGRPNPPQAPPFDDFHGRPEARDWLPVPPEAQAAFPSIAEILRHGAVRLPSGPGMQH